MMPTRRESAAARASKLASTTTIMNSCVDHYRGGTAFPSASHRRAERERRKREKKRRKKEKRKGKKEEKKKKKKDDRREEREKERGKEGKRGGKEEERGKSMLVEERKGRRILIKGGVL